MVSICFVKINARYKKLPLFRKAAKAHELAIVKIIKEKQPRNVATIYNVSEDQYDAEYLDIQHNEDRNRRTSDIASALEQLHAIGIVFVDYTNDNVGYSTIDKVWKLFDFDCSGAIDEQGEWKLEPPAETHALVTAKKLRSNEPFINKKEIDWVILVEEYRELLKSRIKMMI